MSKPLAVVVAIPTFRRPDLLAELLTIVTAQVAELAAQQWCVPRVLVIDNDPAGSARSAAKEGSADYVLETEPGVAAVRNRAIDEAQAADGIAFIDDDERPAPGWLESLVDTWRKYDAVLVAGRVVPKYATVLDPWLAAGRFFERRNMPTGTSIDRAAAGNFLLDVARLRAVGVRFDTRMGLIGGEDTLFTSHLHQLGAPMVWCAESVVYDVVPPERMTRPWVLARAQSHGNSAAIAAILASETTTQRVRARVSHGVGGLLRVGAGTAMAGVGRVRNDLAQNARGHRLRQRGLGMIPGSIGLAVREYGRAGQRRWTRIRLG